MTKLELIKLLGDLITRLDVILGSISLAHPNREELELIRNQMDDRQRQLAKNQFDENTAVFQKATEQLKAINKDLKATIGQLDNLVNTIKTLRKFVSAVDSIVGAVVPVFI